MPTIYFAYGSNMWLDQMHRRCPQSSLIGIALLPNYRWIINTRGYANVVKSASHNVYGILYTLSESDEKRLDISEGVAAGSYDKIWLDVSKESKQLGGSTVNALIYIDPIIQEGPPKTEYITRINNALRDANLPEQWVKENIRPFIKEH